MRRQSNKITCNVITNASPGQTVDILSASGKNAAQNIFQSIEKALIIIIIIIININNNNGNNNNDNNNNNNDDDDNNNINNNNIDNNKVFCFEQ